MVGGMNSNEAAAEEMVFSYSRAQAIEDGVLVDLSTGDMGKLAKEAGLRFPVACTARVYAECIALTPAAKRACNDVTGRAWDVFFMLAMAVKRSRAGGSTITFRLSVVRDRVRATPTDLVAVCGPGDDGEPVLTIMFPGED